MASQIYKPSGARVIHWVSSIAALLFSITSGVVLLLLFLPQLYPYRSATAFCFAAGWVIIPPVWFWIEYYILYLRHGLGTPESFNYFKHGQQVSAAIWAAVTVSLFALAKRWEQG